jgi:hypothetical protein
MWDSCASVPCTTKVKYTRKMVKMIAKKGRYMWIKVGCTTPLFEK